MRKQTDPGGWQGSPGSYAAAPDDETPTRPDNGDPVTIALIRLFGELGASDRKGAVSLLGNWARCTLDQRVIIEAISRELANVVHT